MNPRQYQIDCVDSVLKGFADFDKQVAVLPTGAGKSCIASWIVERTLPGRCLIVAHRSELITQMADKLQKAASIPAQIEKAEDRASLDAPVVVASVQTLQGNRLQRWPQDHFDLVVIDECHHAISDSFQRMLGHFDKHAKVLGITATPDRADRRNLGEYFQNIAFEISLLDLVNQGFLSRIVISSIPIQIDLRGVRQTGGDFNEDDLGEVITPYFHEIARALKEHAPFRKTLAFLPLCNTSRTFVEVCNAEGIVARHVDGVSPDRKQILGDFADGKFDLLSNASLLLEGYDDPSIDCILMLRPTKSRPLFTQAIGRGTRIAPFKENLLLLDFLYLTEKHNLIRPAHLIASTEDQAQAITEIAQEKAKFGQQELDLEVLVSEEQIKREDRLRKQLKDKSKRSAKTVDAMEWCLEMGAHDLVDWEPTMKWEGEPLTPKQSSALKRAGIDLTTVRGKGHASKLLSVYFASQKIKPASEKQKTMMKRMNHPNWEGATAEDARKFFAGMRRAA